MDVLFFWLIWNFDCILFISYFLKCLIIKEYYCIRNILKNKSYYLHKHKFIKCFCKLIDIFKHVLTINDFCRILKVEAGQFCTFLIYSDGTVGACGKGSYGRLGLGDSNNCSVPKKPLFDKKYVKKISSSKGSDGHSLALTTTGEVYSWGDG